MAEKRVEPFAFQKSTNIDEHNQIVDKVNEVVDVINDAELDTLSDKLTTIENNIATNASNIDANTKSIATIYSKLTTDETQIATNKTNIESLRADNIIIIKDIEDIKAVDTEQSEQIATNVDDITQMMTDIVTANDNISTNTVNIETNKNDIVTVNNKVPKQFTLYRTGEGKITVQATTNDESLITSNDLDMVIPYQYDIISGTTERSFKLRITMSNGNTYDTNDFIIPSGGGTDIVVTGITLSKDTTNVNRFHVSINLSDSTEIDSGFITIIDSVSGSVEGSNLTITVNGVSSVPIAIPTGSNYTAGTGIVISDTEIAVDTSTIATTAVTTELASEISTNRNLINRTIDDVNISGSKLVFDKVNGEQKEITIPSSGSWVAINLATLLANRESYANGTEIMGRVGDSSSIADFYAIKHNLPSGHIYTACGQLGDGAIVEMFLTSSTQIGFRYASEGSTSVTYYSTTNVTWNSIYIKTN